MLLQILCQERVGLTGRIIEGQRSEFSTILFGFGIHPPEDVRGKGEVQRTLCNASCGRLFQKLFQEFMRLGRFAAPEQGDGLHT